MKLDALTVIFLIITIPMMLVLSDYIDNKIKTEKTEMDYNVRLLNSTYDAIKAYQLNTVNNAFGDVTTKKVQDIVSATNVFFNSLTANFNYSGYNANVMEEYVPAIAYTMYDGYYIYAPYKNTLTEVPEGTEEVTGWDSSYSRNDEITDGLKPYVYYNCRYIRENSDDDFVITYTLDNYITIQGQLKGRYVYDSGYVYAISNNKDDHDGIFYDEFSGSYWYGGIEFKEDDTEELREYVGDKEYSYVKVNGKKYYLDEGHFDETGNNLTNKVNIQTISDTTINVDLNAGIFFIDSDGQKNYSQAVKYVIDPANDEQRNANNTFLKYYAAITKNKSAYEYFKNAYEFSKAVLDKPVAGYKDKTGYELNKSDRIENPLKDGYGLSTLRPENATIYDSTSQNTTTIKEYGNELIFSGKNIEQSFSNFNQHRQAIIRYNIETNLASAISSFASNITDEDFIMPRISETDWELIENNVCAISFLQGINIGLKKYNSYAVVPNTLTKEYIGEDDIYILTNDENNKHTYCKVNDNTIKKSGTSTSNNDNVNNHIIKTKGSRSDNSLSYYPAAWKLNFTSRQDISGNSGNTVIYYPISYRKWY